MFGNKEKSSETETSTITNKSASSKDIKTLIGEGCKVEGNFFIPTATRIDGTIKGDLTGDSGVVIGVHGKVEGNVCASEVIVYGEIQGNVETDRIELKKGSSINGDISTNHLITENGAMFNGKCAMKAEQPKQQIHPENHNVKELKTESA
jgi:cytoskeletal protein CcmA (bactofilin family)